MVSIHLGALKRSAWYSSPTDAEREETRNRTQLNILDMTSTFLAALLFMMCIQKKKHSYKITTIVRSKIAPQLLQFESECVLFLPKNEEIQCEFSFGLRSRSAVQPWDSFVCVRCVGFNKTFKSFHKMVEWTFNRLKSPRCDCCHEKSIWNIYSHVDFLTLWARCSRWKLTQ